MSSLISDLINLSESSDKIIAEYVWIGGSGLDVMRSKERTLPGPVTDPAKLPLQSRTTKARGSTTKQAPGEPERIVK